MALITVRFYGRLKAFGDCFQLDVRDTAEAVRALIAQLPNLRQQLQRGFYKIRIGKWYIDNRFIDQGFFYKLTKGMSIHITPVVSGAKKAGVFQTIAGAVITAIGVVMLYTPAASFAPNVIGLGIGMMVGGVAQMLTKMPDMSNNGKDSDKKSSTAFSNLQNMAAQGRPIPLAYGRIRCGSMIISQGVETYDAESEQAQEKAKKVGFGKG